MACAAFKSCRTGTVNWEYKLNYQFEMSISHLNSGTTKQLSSELTENRIKNKVARMFNKELEIMVSGFDHDQ